MVVALLLAANSGAARGHCWGWESLEKNHDLNYKGFSSELVADKRTRKARNKIREYDSKRLLKQHFKRFFAYDLPTKSAQVMESTDFNELVENEPWLLSQKLVVKPDMLFGKRGKSGLVGLNLDFAQVTTFVKERLSKEEKKRPHGFEIFKLVSEPSFLW
ncbi:ATP-citrate synthase alpha chain protein 1-like [Gossypium australe]|uniref:ATP-citrate synthase alpha chain protein 1-like n=1 Tax=Gossypium australe TaxID=47621 RepID=A0A5B6VBE8_9ROSI|nr:ATP-citrate synthase alpha chain protein 1-like [Gossypium australe]